MSTIQGTVTHILPTQSGTSAKGTWTKGGFVIKTEDKIPKSVAFTTWSVTVMNEVRMGNIVKVDFDVESREYNGKWYTDIKAWKVEAVGKTTAPQQQAPPVKQSEEMEWPDTKDLKPHGESPEIDVSELPF